MLIRIMGISVSQRKDPWEEKRLPGTAPPSGGSEECTMRVIKAFSSAWGRLKAVLRTLKVLLGLISIDCPLPFSLCVILFFSHVCEHTHTHTRAMPFETHFPFKRACMGMALHVKQSSQPSLSHFLLLLLRKRNTHFIVRS